MHYQQATLNLDLINSSFLKNVITTLVVNGIRIMYLPVLKNILT